MRYISTRGEAASLGFCDALLAGLARDGGLYVPETWPVFSASALKGLRGLPYADLAIAVLSPFIGGEIKHADFARMVRESYATFRHDAVCPLVQTGTDEFALELFHGPTLAFKDVAMQLVSRLMDHVLSERGQRATVVCATSGDTGSAAVEAFADRERTDLFVLFPHGKISDVQRRQMTTSTASNVHALSIDGNFDDCQDLVKAMFNDLSFRDQLALSGVNSINWGRIMAQITYYFSAALSLGAPDRAVSFTVPTGNFGDIFAGYAAMRMGLPIEKLVIATNDNDILARALESGSYEKRGVTATTSPSMDIQISSNFERLLFEASERDSGAVRQMMAGFKQSGAFTIPEKPLAAIRKDFSAGRSNLAETGAMIGLMQTSNGYLIDPHTAVGFKVARETRSLVSPIVVLSTAHPAKFPDAVRAATGVSPALPPHLSDLLDRKERLTRLAPDLKLVQEHISRHTRAV
jgi:threonine synthase